MISSSSTYALEVIAYLLLNACYCLPIRSQTDFEFLTLIPCIFNKTQEITYFI